MTQAKVLVAKSPTVRTESDFPPVPRPPLRTRSFGCSRSGGEPRLEFARNRGGGGQGARHAGLQGAAVDGGRAGVGIGAGEGQRIAAELRHAFGGCGATEIAGITEVAVGGVDAQRSAGGEGRSGAAEERADVGSRPAGAAPGECRIDGQDVPVPVTAIPDVEPTAAALAYSKTPAVMGVAPV